MLKVVAKMDDYISISLLNDFIFCPYSIYLHNVYMESDESQYHAAPQTMGLLLIKRLMKRRQLMGKVIWFLFLFVRMSSEFLEK